MVGPLPKEYPPEGTVRDYFHRWWRRGLLDQIHAALRAMVRENEGHAPEPSAMSIDSQSVKAAVTSGTRGFNAGKKINGVKRHLLIDTLGLVWGVVVHSATLQDQTGAGRLLAKAKIEGSWPRMQVLWADGGYSSGKLVGLVFAPFRWSLVIIKRTDPSPGFHLLPKRWSSEPSAGCRITGG
ncbi:IS5/IS1182 family transposase [Zavarzinella formosa]|uniref:IS5/IS1182 family transposase n=1 Tax=Zavarzinella formosa TaxID=360055 RepID=UPI0002DDAAB9|nr:IS5/IS1182 family transposase [Zavarzinella formosa]